MNSTRSCRAETERLINLLQHVKTSCRTSLSGFRVSLPWTAEWSFSPSDQKTAVTVTIKRAITEQERIAIAVALATNHLKPLRFDTHKRRTTIQFVFQGPLRLVHGTDCAGSPTLEVRENTNIKTRKQLADAYNEQYTARTAA